MEIDGLNKFGRQRVTARTNGDRSGAAAFETSRTTTLQALVVDDSQIARYILSGQLTELGFEVDVADSAESGLGRLERSLPDIVFMDHLLPGIDGLEAVRRLRARLRTASLPIVMYTSQDSEGFVDRARDAGADDVYTKTCEENRLAVILSRLNLLPKAPNERTASGGVTATHPLHRSATAPESEASNRGMFVAGDDLATLLEPSLESHHAKLRKELLAEFAILERYEERMRHDLFSRVESLMAITTDQLRKAFGEDRESRRVQRWVGHLRGLALAMVVLACFGLSFAMNWKMSGKLEQSIAEQQSALRVLEVNTQAQSALRRELADTRALAERRDLAVTESMAPEAAGIVSPDMESESGVAALVTELQAMGIIGPVRIETSAGSFCVTASASGYTMEGANVALQDCESLPVRMSMRGY